MSNFQQLSSLIWNVADDVLRGLFKPHEYGDIILPFVILRRLDCVIEPRKDEIYRTSPSPVIRSQIKVEFYNTSKYDLSRLKQDPKNVGINFRNYINGFSKNVYDIIENFQLDKPVEKLHKNNRLFLLIEKFTAVDLHPNTVDNHTMGPCSSTKCEVRSEKCDNSSFGLRISDLFMAAEDLRGEGKIRSLFDPCCGTGGMLEDDYMITNPPFGVSWKSEEEFMTAEAQNPNGRFFAGTPRTSDGSLRFLQHMIVFFTGITTYIWILNNHKQGLWMGKVQLINGSALFKPIKKSLGSKRKEICPEQQQTILDAYTRFEESDISKIYPNSFLGYTPY